MLCLVPTRNFDGFQSEGEYFANTYNYVNIDKIKLFEVMYSSAVCLFFLTCSNTEFSRICILCFLL